MKRFIVFVTLVTAWLALTPVWASANNNLVAGGNGESNVSWEIRNNAGGLVSSGNLFAARLNHCTFGSHRLKFS